MNDKGKIIDAWIMVEHLSEGDIDIHDKSNIKLADNDEDYYSFFNKAIDEGIKSNNIESYYIYSKKDVPDENTFREYEKGLRTELEQLFEDSADDSEKFNHAIKSVISKYSNDIDSCRYKLLKNVETSDTNLHSFFIDDLESAKSINTDILNSYFKCLKYLMRFHMMGKWFWRMIRKII